jgi:hypothetical protein
MSVDDRLAKNASTVLHHLTICNMAGSPGDLVEKAILKSTLVKRRSDASKKGQETTPKLLRWIVHISGCGDLLVVEAL